MKRSTGNETRGVPVPELKDTTGLLCWVSIVEKAGWAGVDATASVVWIQARGVEIETDHPDPRIVGPAQPSSGIEVIPSLPEPLDRIGGAVGGTSFVDRIGSGDL